MVQTSTILIPIIMTLSLTIFAFVHLGYIAEAREDYDDSSMGVRLVLGQWAQGNIHFVAPAADFDECPEITGLRVNTLNYTWNGTVDGCYCDDELTVGSCSDTQLDNQCEDVEAQEPVNVTKFGNIAGVPQTLCVYRGSWGWLFNPLNADNDNFCDEGFKQCGHPMNPNTVQCIPDLDTLPCPIYNMAIQTGVVCDEGSIDCIPVAFDGTTFTSIRITRYTSDLWATEEDDDSTPVVLPPLSQIDLNEHAMCSNSFKENITPDREDFMLLDDQRSSCGSDQSLATGWIPMGWGLTEAQIFSYNGIDTEYFDDFGGYYEEGTSGSDYTYDIFQKNYFDLKITCRQTVSDIAGASGIDKLQNVELGLAIGAAVLIMFCNFNELYFALKGKAEKPRMRWFRRCFSYFIVIGMMIAAGVGRNKLQPTKEDFEDFVNNECTSSEAVNAPFVFYKKGFTKFYDNMLNTFIVGGIVLGVNLLCDLLYKPKLVGKQSEKYMEQNQLDKKTSDQEDKIGENESPEIKQIKVESEMAKELKKGNHVPKDEDKKPNCNVQ